MYGEQTYGTHLFGWEGGISYSQSHETDLLNHLPEILKDIRELRTILNIQGQEIGLLKWDIEDLFKQFFVLEATWGLTNWEKDLGIKLDYSQTNERRREIIIAKIRGTGTVNKKLVKLAAEAFSGGEVDIVEYPNEYRFEVKFIGVKGIPANIPAFLKMLDEIKPAHLTYTIKYTYTVWNNLKNINWYQAGLKTWNGLKVYEGA